jgi:hypothetical protein
LTKPPAQGHPPLEGWQFNGSPLLKGEEKGVSGHTNRSRTIDPSILKKVIRDESWNSYRIIKMEYDFLVKHGLPLPRKHRLERLKSHFAISPD